MKPSRSSQNFNIGKTYKFRCSFRLHSWNCTNRKGQTTFAPCRIGAWVIDRNHGHSGLFRAAVA